MQRCLFKVFAAAAARKVIKSWCQVRIQCVWLIMRRGMGMAVEVASLPAQCRHSETQRQLLRYLHLQQRKEFTMLVTELIISYATSAPSLSLSLRRTCRVCCPCLAAAVCHAVLPQQLTAGAGQARQSQGKPSQDRPGQQEAVSAQTSLAYSCHVFLLPLPQPLHTTPPPPPTDAKQPPVPSIASY